MRPELIETFKDYPKMREVFHPSENPYIKSQIKKATKLLIEERQQQIKVPFERKKNRKKYELFLLQNGLCAYCDKPLLTYIDCTFDHIKPRSKGGKDSRENLTVVCRSCNQLKANTDSYDEAVAHALSRIEFFKRLKDRGYLK